MMTKSNFVLELRQVSRQFTQGGVTVKALRKTDIAISSGEFVAVVGPSGSGKSTFLTIAGGLQNPSSGKVFIHGQDITNLSAKALSRVRLDEVGFILQASNLVPFLTVEKQLELIDRVTKRPSDADAVDALFKHL